LWKGRKSIFFIRLAFSSQTPAYLVDVELPAGLRTNYGWELEFSRQMQGSAEIITVNARPGKNAPALRAALKK